MIPSTPERGLPRLVEVPLVMLVLLLASPLLLVAAVLVKLTSKGPVLFRQQRMGRGGRLFTLLKFRTMPVNAGSLGETLRRGRRVTPVGGVLRALKIDELPELWNVARGDMALVGPRPEVPEFVEVGHPLWQAVLQARPGITDPVTLRLRSEEQLLAGAGERREHFYRVHLQPYKLRGYRDYLEIRTWQTDVRVLWRTLIGIVVPTRAHPPSAEKLQRGQSPYNAPQAAGPRPMPTASGASWPALVATADLSLAAVSSFAAFWLRFDGAIPPAELGLWSQTLPALLVVRGLTFHFLGVFRGLWRYTSISNLRTIIVGIAASSAAFYTLIQLGLGVTLYPRSVFVIDALLLLCLVGGLRLAYRLLPRKRLVNRDRRVLIVGAGDAAESVVREIRHAAYHRYIPIGFVDDAPGLAGHQIHGVPVLGTIDDLPTLMVEHDPDEVLVALTRARAADFDRIMGILDRFNAAVTTLPYVNGAPKKGFALSQVRRVALDDLLPRDARVPELDVARHFAGRRVLVTGAAGTVGVEVSVLLSGIVDSLILFDRNERGLSHLVERLHRSNGRSDLRAVIGDVVDERAMQTVVAAHAPDVIIHTAGYRHEGLLATNVCEAVRNNVAGARRVADAAVQGSVRHVLLLSNHSAADASTAVGATLRLAELVWRSAGLDGGRTTFAALRLGPLLSHDDGIVRRFSDQIASGGPVTVSHPAAEQAFLLPKEAALFALQVIAGGDRGVLAAAVRRLRVLDLAKSLVRLNGLTPGDDVQISFVGLRPGERLVGTLIGDTEAPADSALPGIVHVADARDLELHDVRAQILQLERAALAGDVDEVYGQLLKLVPQFDVARPEIPSRQVMPLPEWMGEAQAGDPSGRRSDIRPGRWMPISRENP